MCTIIMRSHVNYFLYEILLFFVLCNIIFAANYTAIAQTSPWDTPLDELTAAYKNQTYCQNSLVDLDTDLELLQIEWQECIIPFLPSVANSKFSTTEDMDESEKEKVFYSFFCRDPSAYKNCWSDVIKKLNECTPGKGNTSALIYFAMYDHTCINNGADVVEKRTKAAEEGDLCVHNYATKVCLDSFSEWTSVDVCKRFLSQKRCDDSSIANCPNKVDEKYQLENLNEIQQALQCFPNIIKDAEKVQNEKNSSVSINKQLRRALLVSFTSMMILLLCTWLILK